MAMKYVSFYALHGFPVQGQQARFPGMHFDGIVPRRDIQKTEKSEEKENNFPQP
jgi:hypothetical protein